MTEPGAGTVRPGATGATVLAVDDDPAILRTLSINLRARGFSVELARDGRSALQSVDEQVPDLVLLDLGLPDLDGVSVLRRLRTFTPVPVIVLSARHESDDKVEALNLGADDYVTKPFDMAELVARVHAALRHSRPVRRDRVRIGDTRLDLGDQLAVRHPDTVDQESIHLTPTEWRLIEVLTRHPGQLVRGADLLREVWGPHHIGETGYLRVYLNQLRRKLEDQPSRPVHLITEAGIGYRFRP